jgi:hypothetical protein
MGRGSTAKVRDAHDRRKRKKARLKRRRTENAAATQTAKRQQR